MPVSCSIDRAPLLFAQARGRADDFARLFDYSVVIFRFEAEVVDEAVASIEVGWGSLLPEQPYLIKLLLILSDYAVCDSIPGFLDQVE